MFWTFWKKKRERLFALESPYSTLFNLSRVAAYGYLERLKLDSPTIPYVVREMTDEEMDKYGK